jgi:hypothetical protein
MAINVRPVQRATQRSSAAEGFKVFRPTGNRYDIPRDIIPDGMTYEWKRFTYNGKEDRGHQANLARNRWAPVPADREGHEVVGGEPTDPDPTTGRKHPHEGCIIVDGLILMERPQEITDIVVAEDRRLAKGQVANQIRKLKLVPEGTLAQDGERQVSIKRERDLSIPEDHGYDKE